MKHGKNIDNSKGKQESFSQSSGSAPSSKCHASRETGGFNSKHDMSRKSGMKDRKYTADKTPGV